MPGGGRGSVQDIAKTYTSVAIDTRIPEHLREQIMQCLAGIIKTAIKQGDYVLDYENSLLTSIGVQRSGQLSNS